MLRRLVSLTAVLALAAAHLGLPSDADANQVASRFRGQVIMSLTPFPTDFKSDKAFIEHLRRADTVGFWYRGADFIRVNFMAFFAEPIQATAFTVAVYDITEGRQRVDLRDNFDVFPAPGQRTTQIIAADFVLNKESCPDNRRYKIAVSLGLQGKLIAERDFVIGKDGTAR